jgi:hypothetical protein
MKIINFFKKIKEGDITKFKIGKDLELFVLSKLLIIKKKEIKEKYALLKNNITCISLYEKKRAIEIDVLSCENPYIKLFIENEKELNEMYILLLSGWNSK